MKCEECLPLLEQYADGELEARSAANVGAHLEGCAACARAARRLEEESALFRLYECDAAPAHGFWDEVLAKVAEETEGRPAASHAASFRARLAAAFGQFAAPRFSPALTAALLVFAVGATVALMKYGSVREEPAAREAAQGVAPRSVDAAGDEAEQTSLPVASGEVTSNDLSSGEVAGEKLTRNETSDSLRRGSASRKSGEQQLAREKSVGDVAATGTRRTPALLREEAAPDRLIREAEQKYLAAIRLLARDVNRGRTRLDHEARARFDETLAVVDRTISDTRRAAREHPRDPVAVQYMLTAYAKKVEIMREIARY